MRLQTMGIEFDRFEGPNPKMDDLPLHEGENPELRRRLVKLIDELSHISQETQFCGHEERSSAGRCAVRSTVQPPAEAV